MSVDAQKSRFISLEQWFNSPQGKDISHFFKSELEHLKELLHGEILLQLGSYGKNSWLEALNYVHKWQASAYLSQGTTLETSLTKLPLDRNSVDCVIAPLVLEAFPHQNPIDEIDRILKPMGYAVFLGINAFSFWGLALGLKKFSCFGELTGKAVSVFSIKRAMLHRGYTQCNISSFYYVPPLSSQKWLKKLNILNELGKMISPCPVGFYCLVMQKLQTAHPDLSQSLCETELWQEKRVLEPACQFKPKENFVKKQI